LHAVTAAMIVHTAMSVQSRNVASVSAHLKLWQPSQFLRKPAGMLQARDGIRLAPVWQAGTRQQIHLQELQRPRSPWCQASQRPGPAAGVDHKGHQLCYVGGAAVAVGHALQEAVQRHDRRGHMVAALRRCSRWAG
jgi:hypothetical protein